MKNTLMFLLVSLLLAFSLTACGGGGQTTGTVDDYGTTGQAGSAAGGGANDSMGGNEGYSGDHNSDGYDGSMMEDAQGALDDAGRSVRNAVDGAGNAIDRAF